MRADNYTILVPNMSPIHFDLLIPALRHEGLNCELLPDCDKEAINTGLKYVNNDACYPSICVVGQIMKALLSGKYDLNHVAIAMTRPAAAAVQPTMLDLSAVPLAMPVCHRFRLSPSVRRVSRRILDSNTHCQC